MTTYREWLKNELDSRSRRRHGYSLRAFARDIGLPAPKLSQLLRGICGVSAIRAGEIAQKLKFSPEEKELFVAMVEAEHSRSPLGKKRAKERLESLNASDGFSELSLERFRIISEWHHFAILELTEVSDFDSNSDWIATRLGISPEETRTALERLQDFGLLRINKDGSYQQTRIDLATPSGIPSKEIREHHSRILHLAGHALEAVPIEQRDFSSLTMAINSKQLPEARKWIREFRRKFCKDLQKDMMKDRVYALSIQFFPLDKMEKTNEKN